MKLKKKGIVPTIGILMICYFLGFIWCIQINELTNEMKIS